MTIDDKVIMLLAEKLEKGLKEFYVGLSAKGQSPEDRRWQWYSPVDMLARISGILARTSSDPHLQAIGVVSFGALRLLGIKGTVQLVLNLRRKNASNKQSKPSVPGVRDGRGTDDRPGNGGSGGPV